MNLPPSRDAAWTLLTEWTAGEGLRKHALAVEAAVRGYARAFGEDETAWGVVWPWASTISPQTPQLTTRLGRRGWVRTFMDIG